MKTPFHVGSVTKTRSSRKKGLQEEKNRSRDKTVAQKKAEGLKTTKRSEELKGTLLSFFSFLVLYFTCFSSLVSKKRSSKKSEEDQAALADAIKEVYGSDVDDDFLDSDPIRSQSEF